MRVDGLTKNPMYLIRVQISIPQARCSCLWIRAAPSLCWNTVCLLDWAVFVVKLALDWTAGKSAPLHYITIAVRPAVTFSLPHCIHLSITRTNSQGSCNCKCTRARVKIYRCAPHPRPCAWNKAFLPRVCTLWLLLWWGHFWWCTSLHCIGPLLMALYYASRIILLMFNVY